MFPFESRNIPVGSPNLPAHFLNQQVIRAYAPTPTEQEVICESVSIW
jgi:hypothetical protein